MFDIYEFYKKLNIDPIDDLELFLKKVSVAENNLIIEFLYRGEFSKDNQELIRNNCIAYFDEFETKVGFESMPEITDVEKHIREFLAIKYPSCISWIDSCDIVIEESQGEFFCAQSVYDNKDFIDEMKRELKAELDKNNLNITFDFCAIVEEDAPNIIETIKDEEEEISNYMPKQKSKPKDKKPEGKFKFGRGKIGEIKAISELNEYSNKVTIKGKVFKIEEKDIESEKGNFKILLLYVNDKTNSLVVKLFLRSDKFDVVENIKKGKTFLFTGSIKYDNFMRQDIFAPTYIEESEEDKKSDPAKEKRVELRLHTNMSAMEGVSPVKDIIKRAKDYGHSKVAITDRESVQGYPIAAKEGKDNGVGIIYGLDGYLVDDERGIITDFNEDTIENRFVVFDLETTGLSPMKDKIVEIGAVKIVDGQITDRFSTLVNPKMKMSQGAEQITGITNERLDTERTIEEVLPEFLDFIDGFVLVAHNSDFDTAFIRREMNRMGLRFNYPVLDTLKLAPTVLPPLKSYTLTSISKYVGVMLTRAHRAVNDAEATAEVLLKLLDMAKELGADTFTEINELYPKGNIAAAHGSPVTILVKNQIGLKNMYKIVSKSHMDYFFRVPKIPVSLLKEYRDGLIVGSGNSDSYLFDGILFGKEEKELQRIANLYDYLEIQPPSNSNILIVSERLDSISQIEKINNKIYDIGKKLNKPVVATGDVFYLDTSEDLIRRIILNGDVSNFDRYKNVNRSLYYKTTEEMLNDFSYMGEDKAYEVVVTNSNLIADEIEEVKPIPDGTYPPFIEGSEEMLKQMCYDNAHRIYGDELPEIVSKRLKRELDSIIKNGYAVLYIIANKVVKKSNEDGYIVGSRGSVGSSFAATMADITEVNPLPPHYVCPNCKHSEFIDDPTIGSGVDLPEKDCPVCGTHMRKDGHNIPFEVFLGFDGDKEPDIDLNFAGEYQPTVHKYVEDLFGKGYVFRAGTVGTCAEKTAYGYVKKYFEDQQINSAEIERLALCCEGIKRTSGQHPGGVMIVPKEKEIYDFTPVQYPADKADSGVITTHFAYEHISGRILKLDLLGHDGPTIIKMLEDLSGFSSKNIDLGDLSVMELFRTADPLKIDPKILQTSTGTLGIPEFGTNFVKQMLIETNPQNFSELVRISGLSHGTNVWTNNAQILVKEGRAELKDVISTREDIMLYLIRAGAENKMAFMTMEKVRKGKGLTPEDEGIMSGLELPTWYIDSCNKIKYMFPKAHAVAYVMLSFRIAYYKLYYPLAFYATFFTINLEHIDGTIISKGVDAVKERMEEIRNKDKQTKKDKDILGVLEVVLEMYGRGFEFEPIDLYDSEAKVFSISKDNRITIPFRSILGLGDALAEKIVEDRKNGEYISVEDFRNRTGAGKSIIEVMRENNLFKNMQEDNQLSLFDF